MKLGVVQGRLSKPVCGLLQEFPFDTWEKEFDDLKELGLSHIEWIVTKESFDKNPLFTRDLSSYPISAICLDNIVDDIRFNGMSDNRFFNEQIKPVLEAGKKLHKPVIFPTLHLPIQIDQEIIKNYHVLLETNLITVNLESSLVYDTGNITSSHGNHKDFIYFYSKRIHTIHLKDRFKDGRPAFPGTGDTDFPSIFNWLSYHDKTLPHFIWTMQTARGLIGLEKETIRYHKLYFEKLYNDYIL